jgi:hypothetical protein
MSLPPLRVQFVAWDKSEAVTREGIQHWEAWWRTVMREREQATGKRWILAKPKALDVRDPSADADVQIHMGIPLYGAVPWSHVNWVWMPAGSAWRKEHDGILSRFDAVVWEREEDKASFLDQERAWVLPLATIAEAMGRVEDVAERLRARRPSRGVRHLPPVLEQTDCPPVSIVTPTFQRKKLMEIAFHNLLMTDYPLDKMEWIVVEDNDKSPHQMKRPLEEFQAKVPALRIRYIPLEGRRSVGEKRNVGVREASHEWILFMDDDDHYPATSFRRRMAWLMKGVAGGRSARVACCTTIALYDLKRGVSAVNVPPVELALSQRISEATLTFHRSVWEERPFPEVSVAEGEGWLVGRESEVIELPPQQIIVAFTHGSNQSSRRLPPSDQPAACFWGFPKEYLVFIHGLVGVEIA